MVQYIRYRVPDLAYPRFQFFKDRLGSIYPRFRKAVAKKTWKTVTEDSNYAAEEKKLLKGPLRQTAEFQLSSHVEKSVLDDLVSDVYPTTQLKPEIWVLGQSIPLAKCIQSSKFPKDQKASILRMQNQTIVPATHAPFVVVLMVDLRSASADWKQVILDSAGGDKVQLQTLATRDDFLIFVQEDTGSSEADVKQNILRGFEQHFAAIVKEESIVVNAGLGDKICNRLEVLMIRKFDKIMDYICRFPCQVPPHFAEELDDKQNHLLGVLTDGLEDMVCKRWMTLDLWLGEIQNMAVSLDHKTIYKQVRLAIAKRLRNILLQELSPVGGMTQMLINAAVESVIDIPMLFESTLDEELERKLRDIIHQQLHLDFLKDHFSPSHTKILPRASDVRHAYAEHIHQVKETNTCGCERTVHRREYRVFAASVMQSIRIHIILQKLITSMTVADNALLTLHKLRFEVLGVQRQTIAKEKYESLYQTEEPSRELVDRLKLISGVSGWGLIYGRLHVHLTQQEKVQLKQTRDTLFRILKNYYPDFTIETVTSPPKFLTQNIHHSGKKIWCISTPLPSSGTLGCFVYEPGRKNSLSLLTCAHVIMENEPVYIEQKGDKVVAGIAEYTFVDQVIDLASVKADQLIGSFSKRFYNPALKKFPGTLFFGDLYASEITSVFKEGATTALTRGIIVSPKYHRVVDLTRDVILIEAESEFADFASKGDSGAVVCARDMTSACKGVYLISMITSGDMKAGNTRPFTRTEDVGSSSESMDVDQEPRDTTVAEGISGIQISRDKGTTAAAAETEFGRKVESAQDRDSSEEMPKAKKMKTGETVVYSRALPQDEHVSEGASGSWDVSVTESDVIGTFLESNQMDVETFTAQECGEDLQLTGSSESEPEVEEDSEEADFPLAMEDEESYNSHNIEPHGKPRYNFVTSFRLAEGLSCLNKKHGKNFHLC